jgi:hypothetical protein
MGYRDVGNQVLAIALRPSKKMRSCGIGSLRMPNDEQKLGTQSAILSDTINSWVFDV